MSSLRIQRIPGLRGTLRPPSDKSLTHRAYLLGALARDGETRIAMPLRGDDCDATLRCLAGLGVAHRIEGDTTVVAGGQPLASPSGRLDCGNSGTTMRLLSGVVASSPGVRATLVGDDSLSRRPMGRVVEPLRLMGAEIEGVKAPVVIRGQRLRGIEYRSPVASAQVKSCVLLAGLRATGETWFAEPAQSRDHTERMLRSLGVTVRYRGANVVGVTGGETWSGFRFRVPGDVSSAAFFMVAAALVAGSEVTFADLGVNPTRTGLLDVFADAGVRFHLDDPRDETGEPVADVTVRGGSPLRSFEVTGDRVPRLIDEVPVLAVLATQCDGVSRFRDAAELRVKESDRIERMAAGLRAMGAQVETYPDGLDVVGPVPLRGATIQADDDHRIAMAFAVAGMIAEGETVVQGAESIATSYPGFERDLANLAVL